MTVDTVLFDLDGTITDSLPVIERTYISVFQEMGIPWGNAEVMRLIGLPLREIGRIMAGEGKEDEFFDTYQRHYAQIHDQSMGLFPGTREMLDALLTDGFQLAVVTSKSLYGADMTLSFLNIQDYFPVIVTADDPCRHKPHPDPVLLALKKLNKKLEQAVFVGDSPFDISSGNRAGVTTIAVTWGMADEKELEKYTPNLIVHNRKELLARIRELGTAKKSK